MPSGWEVYYVVFLSAVLALSIPALLGLVSAFSSSRRKQNVRKLDISDLSPSTPEVFDVALGRRINTRVFLGANTAILLLTLALILIPCAGVLAVGDGMEGRGLVCIVSIAALAGIGLLYAARKGDLDWLRSFRPEDDTK